MSKIDNVTESLGRVQEYNTDDLVQTERLGRDFEFADIVLPAKRLIALFQKIPISALPEFPDNELNVIKSQADSIYNLFDQVMNFDPRQADAQSKHQGLVEQIKGQIQPLFSNLHPFISYAMARTVDFNALADQGRAAVQGVKDQVAALMSELSVRQEEAQKILEDARKAAAEQGVSQQAYYFAEESKEHGRKAKNWKKVTTGVAIAVAIVGASMFFLHRLQFMAPQNFYETVQITASKVLVFLY